LYLIYTVAALPNSLSHPPHLHLPGMAALLIPVIGLSLAEAGKKLCLAALRWGGPKIHSAVASAVTGANDPTDQIKT
jgi:hypothetical protein